MQWPIQIWNDVNGMGGQDIHSTYEDGVSTFYETCPPNPGVIEDYELMQFTGLLDKNGKEIYCGDIVSWSDGDYKSVSNPRIAEVRLYPSLHFFAFNVGGGHAFHYGNFIYRDTENYLEVIGNKFQTPELLQQT